VQGGFLGGGGGKVKNSWDGFAQKKNVKPLRRGGPGKEFLGGRLLGGGDLGEKDTEQNCFRGGSPRRKTSLV